MIIKDILSAKRDKFEDLCRQFDVKSIYLFGSSLTESESKFAEDVDLLVELRTEDPIIRGENLIQLWDQLESFFQKRVDLLTEASLHNPIFRNSVHSTKILLYDGEGLKISL